MDLARVGFKTGQEEIKEPAKDSQAKSKRKRVKPKKEGKRK